MQTYRIEDMTCGGCVRAIRVAVARVAPQANVEADVESRRVTVAGAPDPTAVEAAITAAGFEPVPIEAAATATGAVPRAGCGGSGNGGCGCAGGR